MPVQLERIEHNLSYQPDWNSTWREVPCDCAPAPYAGMIPFFQPTFYPDDFVDMNEDNRKRCVDSIYDQPSLYSLAETSECLVFPPTGGTIKPSPATTSKVKGMFNNREIKLEGHP